MPVVPAAVHASLEPRHVRKVVFLVHRQRVHVGPQSDRASAAGRCAANHADNPGLADAGMVLHAKGRQLARDHFNRTVFFEAELGMRMQVAAQRRQCGVVVAQMFDRPHADGQCCAAGRSMRSRGSTA